MDKCGVCGGDNTTCRLVSGVFKHSLTKIGYHKIVEIPEGATKINVTEMVKSRNYLGGGKEHSHWYSKIYPTHLFHYIGALKMSVFCSLCHITHLEAMSLLTATSTAAVQQPHVGFEGFESTFPQGKAIIVSPHSLLCWAWCFLLGRDEVRA